MKILLVGVFTHGSTDCWKKLALERLGHRVVCAPYRDRNVEEHFRIGVPFDVVFVSKGVPLTRAQLTHLATLGMHRLLWWPDPFENWNAELTAALASGAWRLAATSQRVIERIAESSTTAYLQMRILEGCDCEGPRPEWVPEVIEPRLLHFGALTPRRLDLIEKVRAAGVEVDVLERPTYGAQLQKAVLSHAAVLGINSSPDLYSNRVQTVLAMGGVLLQEEGVDSVNGLPCPLDLTPATDTIDRSVRIDADYSPIALWRSVERIIGLAQDAIADGRRRRNGALAVAFHSGFRWECVMQRALAFATYGGVA